jgi:hypothetical protein
MSLFTVQSRFRRAVAQTHQGDRTATESKGDGKKLFLPGDFRRVFLLVYILY